MFRILETALTSMHIHEPERMENGGRAYFASANYARSGFVARGSGFVARDYEMKVSQLRRLRAGSRNGRMSLARPAAGSASVPPAGQGAGSARRRSTHPFWLPMILSLTSAPPPERGQPPVCEGDVMSELASESASTARPRMRTPSAREVAV